MNSETVLLLGARSDIGRATAREFAKRGYTIQLAARQAETLSSDKSDLELRYRIPVSLHEYDTLATETLDAFVSELPKLPDIAICAVGFMEDQEKSEQDIQSAIKVLRSNFEGPAMTLALLANRFEQRGSGTIVGISSVAGDRGRATNYVYGSSKAGFTAFLSGLRNRMFGKNVHVMTVKPGFVDTRMTDGLDLPPKLTATTSEVATAIANGVEKQRNTVYVKPIWWLVMSVICSIPEKVFKRLRI